MDGFEPRIAEHYDDLAAFWTDVVASPTRTDLLWPAIEALLPDMEGHRVLDAGCGSGVYTAKLIEQGAEVIGVDVSDSMVQQAKEHVPEATFRQADLSHPLEFIEDSAIEIVLCQHVFSHIEDLSVPLEEFARVLSEDGILVVSTHNPIHDYLVVRDEFYPVSGDSDELEATVETPSKAPQYSKTERFDIVWNPETSRNRGTYYRRSIEDLFMPVLEAGFELQAIVEPVPDDKFESDHPDIAEDLHEYPPESICLRAQR